MEIEVVSRKENMVIGRTEVAFKAVHSNERTPKRTEIKEKLAELLNVNKGNVVVDNMKSDFGRAESTGYVKIYKNVEDGKGLERDYILKRNNLFEKKEKKTEEKKEGKTKEGKTEVKEKADGKGKKSEEKKYGERVKKDEKAEEKAKKIEKKEVEKTEKKEKKEEEKEAKKSGKK